MVQSRPKSEGARAQEHTPLSDTATRRRPQETLEIHIEAASRRQTAEWELLAERLQAAPFLYPGWILAWSAAFAPGHLMLISVRRNGRLAGIAPCLRRGGVLSFPVNWHTPLAGFLAEDEDARAMLAQRLVTSAAVRTDLAFIDQDDPTLGALVDAASTARRASLVRPILHSPYVPLEGHTWDHYRGALDRKVRREVERCVRRLRERGRLRVEVEDGRGDLQAALADGLRLESSGWKLQSRTAIASDPTLASFYTQVAQWASKRGWLALTFLMLDRHPIAFDLCLHARGVFYALKGGFDPAYRSFGPGKVLTYESLRLAFELGAASYELLGDADAYKLPFAAATRRRMRFQAFARSPLGWLDRLAWTHGRKLALAARRRHLAGKLAG
jgi:CelD/BcsL family acetyltransferase involved in cellulose biosynthesis